MECAYLDYGWEHVASIYPGNAWPLGNLGASRIVYSPNGELYGECFAQGDGTLRAAFFGSDIFIGCNGGPNGLGLRSFPVPQYTLGHPLIIGRGGRNLLASVTSSDIIGTISSGNSVTLLTSSTLPTGVTTKPPCSGPVFLCEATGGTELGIWRLTGSSATVPPGHLRLRLYIYPLAESIGGYANCMGLTLAVE